MVDANLAVLRTVDSISVYKSIIVQINVGSPSVMFADVCIRCISQCAAHVNIAVVSFCSLCSIRQTMVPERSQLRMP
jgi:hypothetical protein